MTSERWQLIESIFHRVLASPPADRAGLLASSCGGDGSLRAEVEALLAAEANSASFLASSSADGAASVAVETPSLLGRRFGQFEILALLGNGSMGEVYLARDSRLDRKAAVKILPARFSGDHERVTRFMREAKAASTLNFPNIVTVFDGGEEHGTCYIATEFIEGVTLRQRLAAGPLPLPEALEIARQSAAALGAAHQAGVLHRDVKPENIMVRPDGVVKLVDFGLARIAADDLDADDTHAGAVLGTPRYMAPEQARGERADASSDVFSLGAVFYEMVTGRPAFPGRTAAETLATLLSVTPPAPSLLNPSLPRAVDDLCARALAKPRAARIPSMAAFSAALAELTPPAPPASRRRFLAAAGAATAVLAGAGFVLRRRGPDGPPAADPWNPVPLTSFAGFKDFPALSPDGSRVAFVWNGGRGGLGGRLERELYVKPVGPGDPVRLSTENLDTLWPAWSPDGARIAFGRPVDERRSQIFVISSTGGPERQAATAGNGVGWSPDSQSLLLGGVRSSAPATAGIRLFHLESGASTTLTTPAQGYDERPALSPDGRLVAYTHGADDDRRRIAIVPLSGGAPRMLDHEPTHIAGIAWAPGGDSIVFSAIVPGASMGLNRVPLNGGPASRLGVSSELAVNPTISASSRRLAYNIQFVDTNLYRSTAPRFDNPQPFILSSREDDNPVFSPDGRWLAFVSGRSGKPEVWIARADGTGLKQLTDLRSRSLGSPRWSPDGAFLAFDAVSANVTDIYVVPATGGPLRRVTSTGQPNYLPSWSRDGASLFFTSSRGGRNQIWRIPATGGEAVPITRGGAREAAPSPDGARIYFTRSRPESRLWTVPVAGGQEEPVAELAGFDRIARSWTILPNGIAFLSREDGPIQTVRFFDFATRRVTPLARLTKEPIWLIPALALSPDGTTLLTAHLDHEVNDLMIVENFQ